MLEIGCGAGRVTRALAQCFGQVHAVDISPEMVRRARQAVQAFPNAYVHCNNGKDLSALRGQSWNAIGIGEWRFDFAFSCIVFQHIPSRQIIENYVREVNRVLRRGRLFKFQVQGAKDLETDPENTWQGVSFLRSRRRGHGGAVRVRVALSTRRRITGLLVVAVQNARGRVDALLATHEARWQPA